MYQRTTNQFQIADYVVFVIFLLASCGIGIFFSLTGSKQKSTEEFLMGNRKMQVIPTAISLVVSFTSAILILGNPSEMYQNGTMFAFAPVGSGFSCLIAATIFVPIFYRLRLTSSYEYLEIRFRSRLIRRMGTIFFMLNQLFYMGIAMFAPSTAMEFVTGGRMQTEYSIILAGIVGTFYTTMGGIKAVIWTDVFQAGMMLAGIYAVIIKGAIEVGGLGNAFNEAYEKGRIELDNISFDPRTRHTVWSLIIGIAISRCASYGINQSSVQRYCALPTLNKARASVLINIFSELILIWSTCLAGIVVFAYYSLVNCDPIAAGFVRNQNQIVPYFVMDLLAIPCIPGVFLASLFAGALSSVSSSLSSLSAVTWKDFLETACFPNVSETKAVVINKIIVVVFGVLGIGIGLAASLLSGSVLQASISFSGSFVAPLLGLFFLGVLFRFTNKYGAFVGSICGLCLSSWMNFGAYIYDKPSVSLLTNTSSCDRNSTFWNPKVVNKTDVAASAGPLDDLYSVSYLWFPSIGALATVLIGLIVSLITGRERDVKDQLVVNWGPCCFGLKNSKVSFDLELETKESGVVNEVYNSLENIEPKVSKG